MSKTLIYGGTGTTGRTLVDLLKESKSDFVAATTSEEKAGQFEKNGIQAVHAPLGEWSLVEKALPGIDTVFLLTSPSPDQTALQNGLIDRAAAAGVRRVIKLSAVIAEQDDFTNLGRWHLATENHLRDSGLDYVIIRPHSFMQNILMSRDSIVHQDAIYQSLGTTKLPLVDTRDVALACHDCIVSEEFDNGSYLISGGESISYQDVAQALSKALGRKMSYVPISPEDHNAAMKNAGLPDWLADDLANMSRAWMDDENTVSGDFKKITGKSQRTVNDFARDYAHLLR